MRLYFKVGVLLISGIVLGACNSGQDAGESAGGEGTASMSIAVIPKGTDHIFWKTVHAGAAKAGKEQGVEIFWVGPESEGDRRQQIDIVQNFISRQIDAIVLAPLDESALIRPVTDAMNRDIPVIIMDSGLKGDNYISFVATDNKEGGRLGARHLGTLLGVFYFAMRRVQPVRQIGKRAFWRSFNPPTPI